MLKIAILNDDIEMMKLLLDRGTTKWGIGNCRNQAMGIALHEKRWRPTESLLERGLECHGSECLSIIQYGPMELMRQWLKQLDVKANSHLLFHAASLSDVEKFQLLLNEGANVRVRTKKAYCSLHFIYVNGDLTPLHIASANCKTPLMQLILDNGADIEDADDTGRDCIA